VTEVILEVPEAKPEETTATEETQAKTDVPENANEGTQFIFMQNNHILL